MIAKRISYGELYRLLLRLEFVDISNESRWRTYRQNGSDLVILLANREPATPARSADLISVRRHLVDNGLLEKDEFERLLS